MLSSRSQNVTSSSTENILPLSSTRNIKYKTPARTFRVGRAVHDENSVYGHPKTAGFTGRKKRNVLFSTPAGNGPLQSRLKTDKVPRFASKSTALAEITNQTPFNKTLFPVTPGCTSLKPSKSIAILSDDVVATSARRISSTRKKLRLPRSTSKNYETPETRGNYWDVSDASIEGSETEDISITEDYDDVEYAPPTAIDPKYDPGFDMPDYKEVGVTLMSLFRQTIIPDPISNFDNADLLKDMGPLVLEKWEMPHILSDDVFPSMVRSESHHAIPRSMVNPRATSSGHTRTTSVPSRTTSTTNTRTGSRPPRTMSTVHPKSTNALPRMMGGMSKPVIQSIPSTERKPGVRSQQSHVPKDTVLSLLADSANEPLGDECLFKF